MNNTSFNAKPSKDHPPSTPAAPRRRYTTRQTAALMSMTIPGVLLLIIFAYLPMVGAVVAFKNYDPALGILNSPWAGFKNFAFLFNSGVVWRVTRNTVLLNAIFIVTSTAGALLIALLIHEIRNRARKLANFYQTALFFPFFISYVIVGYFGYALLNADQGLINHVRTFLGLQPIGWYSSPQYWPLILTLANLWKGVGFGVVIYLSGMLAIDSAYYEAASLDGASKLQQARFVTLPFIAPLITLNVLLALGRVFYADFGLFYNLTRDSGLLYPTTDVIDTYVFRALRTLGDFGMSGAAALYQSLAGLLLVLLSNWIVRRRNSEQALF